MNVSYIKKLALTALICAAFPATAIGQGRVIAQAYEILLDNFQAPASAASTIVFRECDDCERIRTRVTAATIYSVNGRSVQLDEFRIAIQQAGDRDSTAVTILHHLESDTVQSIDASI